MRSLFFIIILLSFSFGCQKKKGAYEKGLAFLGFDDINAAKQFQIAVATEDNLADAHYQLALIYEKDMDTILLAAWHIQQYLRLMQGIDEQKNVVAWLEAVQVKAIKHLNKSVGALQDVDVKLELKLLKEHAAKQKTWLQELSSENITLRKQLAESNGK